MITFDTSGLYAVIDRRSSDHSAVTAFLETDPGPYLFPMGALGELAYLIERR